MYRRCLSDSHMFMGRSMMSLVLILALLVFVVWLFTKNRNKKDKELKSTANTALKILQERYAKGEIDETEYVSKKKILEDK